MKVVIYKNIIIAGLVSDVDKRITEKEFTITAQLNLPAVPRVGEELHFCEFSSTHPIHSAKVKEVAWWPVEGKINVLQPYLHLNEWEWNEGKEADELEPLEEEIKFFKKEIRQTVGVGEVQFAILNEK